MLRVKWYHYIWLWTKPSVWEYTIKGKWLIGLKYKKWCGVKYILEETEEVLDAN